MKKLLIFNEKITRFIFSESGCGTTCYSNLKFLKSLCEELSESMVGSFGIHFFTRLDSGEQCTVSPRTVYRIVIKNLTIWMKIHCSSLPICIGRGPKKFKIQTNVNKTKLFETNFIYWETLWLNLSSKFSNLCDNGKKSVMS